MNTVNVDITTLIKRTTMSEFLAMSLEVMDGNMPDMMWDVIDACDYLIY